MPALTMDDLPPEIIVMIFKHLSVTDLQNCCQTCLKWEGIAVDCFFQPQLRSLAEFDDFTKKSFRKKGWTHICQDKNLIILLHKRYKLSIVVSLMIRKSTTENANQDGAAKLVKLFLEQNNLTGEFAMPAIMNSMHKHSFSLRFVASPDLVRQIKSLDKVGYLGGQQVGICLYNTGKPHLNMVLKRSMAYQVHRSSVKFAKS